MNRRLFLATCAAAPALLKARSLGAIGVQLYTVRDVIGKKPLETLKAIEQLGFKEFEAVYNNIDQIWPYLQQTSLRPVSIHLETAMFSATGTGASRLPAAIGNAASKGFKYVVCPYVGKDDRGGPDVMRKLGERLNQAGELAAKAGMQLCYHNHAFEFAPADKSTLLDIMLAATDPQRVFLELDVMWAKVAGIDPAEVMKKYSKRTLLLHLKDVATTEPQRFDEGIARTSFKEVGAGAIGFPALLKAASGTSVKHYFVEQDQTSGDPVASLKQSIDYLSKLDF